MLRYIGDVYSALESDDPYQRKAAALMLMNDPLAAQAQIPLNPSNQEKVGIDKIQKAMNMLENYGEMNYYSFLTKMLTHSDDRMRKTVYGYLKNDSRVNKEMLDQATDRGTRAISDTTRDVLLSAINQAYEGEQSRRKQRIESGTYSNVNSNQKYTIPEGQGQLVVSAQAGPLTINNSEGAIQAFEQVATDIIKSPQAFSDQLIDQRSSELYMGFAKYTNVSNQLPPQAFRNMFNAFKYLAPFINASPERSKEIMQRAVGQTLIDFRDGKWQAGVQNLAGICQETGKLLVQANQMIEKVEEKKNYLQKMGLAMEQEATRQITGLREENASLLSQNTGLNQVIGSLNNTIAQSAQELRQKNYEIGEKQSQIDTMMNAGRNLENQLKAKNAEYDQMADLYRQNESRMKAEFTSQAEANRLAYQEKLDKLVEELNGLKTEYAKNQLQLQNAQQENTALKREIVTISETISQCVKIEGSISQCVREVIQQKTAAEQQRDANYVLYTESEKLKTQINETLVQTREKLEGAMVTITERETTILNQSESIRTLKAQVESAKNQMLIYEEKQKVYIEEARTLSQKIVTIETQLRNTESSDLATRNELQAQIKSLEVQLSNAISGRDENARLINQIKEKNTGLLGQINEYDMKLKQVQAEKESLNNQLQSANTSSTLAAQQTEQQKLLVDALNTRLAETQKDLSTVSGKLIEANSIIEQKNIAIAQAQNDGKLLEASKKALEQQMKLKDLNYKENIEKMEKENSSLRSQTTKALLEKEGAVSAAMKAELKRKAAEDAKTKAELGLSEARAKNSTLMKEFQANQAELDKLRAAAAEDHTTDVIMAEVDPPAMPDPVINIVCETTVRNAGRKPKAIVVEAPAEKRTVIPPKLTSTTKKKKVVLTSTLPKTTQAAVQTRAKKSTSIVRNTTTSRGTSVSSGGRARNTLKGGYVVGGRPDPYINPKGPQFWQNLYKSHYHLF